MNFGNHNTSAGPGEPETIRLLRPFGFATEIALEERIKTIRDYAKGLCPKGIYEYGIRSGGKGMVAFTG
jgi:hypothetical protein